MTEPTWEYFDSVIDHAFLTHKLNNFGTTGWELVAVLPYDAESSRFVFKRHAKESPEVPHV